MDEAAIGDQFIGDRFPSLCLPALFWGPGVLSFPVMIEKEHLKESTSTLNRCTEGSFHQKIFIFPGSGYFLLFSSGLIFKVL